MVKSSIQKRDQDLISESFLAQEYYHDEWLDFEYLYKNTQESPSTQKKAKIAQRLNRNFNLMPIARDVVRIISSIFANSFFSGGCPIVIKSDDGKVEGFISDLNKLVKKRYKVSKPFTELKKAFLSALVFRLGVVAQYYDVSRKKHITEHINVKDIAFDKYAKNINDVNHISFKYKKTKKEILEKIKSKFYNKAKVDDIFGVFDKDSFDYYTRVKLQEIYIKENNGWVVRTYYDNKILRERFTKKLSFQYGYAIERLSSVDDSKREEEVMVYGDSMIGYIQHHMYEINRKRNQKNDITEENINPSTYIGSRAKVNPEHLKRGAGSKIPVKGNIDDIKERRAPNSFDLKEDLEMIRVDIENTTGVNSILKGATNPSDRRSANALAMVNSQSSGRVEDCISTINDTLMTHWAETFVYICYESASNEELVKLGIDPVAFRNIGDIDYEIKVNFGSNIDKDKKVSELIQLLQVLGQQQNIPPQILSEIIIELVTLLKGQDDHLVKKLLEINEQVGIAANNEEPPTQFSNARV